MIITTTYTEKEDIQAINQLLGKPFSLLERLKMGGIGSSRLMIAQVSPKFLQQQFSEIDYANIELRPKGIIVHFTNRLERFAWAIPYYKLYVYSTGFFSIHAEGSFIKLHKNTYYKNNKKFIDKMLDLKIANLKLGYYDG